VFVGVLSRGVSVLTSWEQLAGMIVRWYAIAIVAYAVLWAFWVLSGSDSYNMVINMIAGLSGLIIIIVVIEVLRRKVKFNH
jgi:capsular polysaccharide biosynthesis protein